MTVGFDGAFRPGVPVAVELRIPALPVSGAGQAVVDAVALSPQAGRATMFTTVSFQAVAGVPQTIRIPIQIADVRRPLQARVVVGGRVVARAAAVLDPSRIGRVVALVSNTRAGLGALRALDRHVVGAYVGAASLPSTWQDYASVDLLVLRDLDPARLSDRQREAMLTWVRLGGRLVVIARPGIPLPDFLVAVLPARAGPAGVLPRSTGLDARYGAALPPGAVPVVALVPAPGANVVRAGPTAVVVSGAAGDGRVAVWGIDPTTAPLADWTGRVRLWADAIGVPRPPLVDSLALGRQLDVHGPVDRPAHLAAGLLIAAYVAGLVVLRRRRPTLAGAAAGVVIAAVAAGVFSDVAAGTRARSTALSQVVVLQQAAGAPIARAIVVAAAAVPYGGPVTVQAPAGAVAAPVDMRGDLRIDLDGGAGPAVLSARALAGAPWVFQAAAAVPLAASARLDPADETLTVDVPAGLHGAAVWWHGLVYRLGDLQAGRSAHPVGRTGWRRASEVAAEDRSPARFFRAADGETPGAIAAAPRPVLVGEWSGPAPAFALPGSGRRDWSGVRDAVLIVPIAGPPPAVERAP